MDYDGLGVFFYPIVLSITEKERINNRDSEWSKPPHYKTRKIVLDHSLEDNTRIVVTDDGFVGIFKDIITDALDILNTIFATGITFGVGSAYGRERDLCKFTLTGDGTYLQLDEIGGPLERNMFSFQRDDDSKFFKWRGVKFGTKLGRMVISIQDIKEVLDKSYNYLAIKDSKKHIYQDLLLLLDGYTLFYSDAFRGAYIYGWMIIETVIDHLWKEYVTTLKISSDDKKNLDSSQWTTYHKIEVLFALEKIDPKYRNLLKRLRKKRNDIIHEKETASRREAFECLRLAAVTTPNRMLGNTDIFHDPKEKQMVKILDRMKSENNTI
jgi:hypothetical protein